MGQKLSARHGVSSGIASGADTSSAGSKPWTGSSPTFVAFELRLIIELEGSRHAQPSQMHRDQSRDRQLQRRGFRVLHLPNGLVLRNPEAFIKKVEAAIVALHPSPPAPLPIAGEGQGVRGRFVNPTTDGSPATPVTPAFYSDPTSRRYT